MTMKITTATTVGIAAISRARADVRSLSILTALQGRRTEASHTGHTTNKGQIDTLAVGASIHSQPL